MQPKGLGVELAERAASVYDLITPDRKADINNVLLSTAWRELDLIPYRNLIFNTAIRIKTLIAESSHVGKPVVFYRQSSYGAADYKKLAAELMERG